MADSRYPNMSYCMFENTQSAMNQLLEHMRESIEEDTVPEFITELSRYETRAMKELYDMCNEYMRVMEQIEEIVEDVQEA